MLLYMQMNIKISETKVTFMHSKHAKQKKNLTLTQNLYFKLESHILTFAYS